MKRLLALCALALLLTLTTPVARAGDLTPPAPVTPATTVYTINVGAGLQSEPHISGTLVSYTDYSVSGIAYYDLATGQSGAISPPAPGYDSQSDVSEGKVVFTRVGGTNNGYIYAFDVNTPGAVPYPVTSPIDSGFRRRPGIGHGTIAWEERLAANLPEIGVYDPVLGRAIQLTNDVQNDQWLAVSADGSTVVWEKCASATACHIYQATRGNGSWTPVQLTGNVGQPVGFEEYPDTNGQIVVYDCARNGEADICWQPVGGGSETRLLMPGVQVLPHIAGDVISFESSASTGTQFDLYAYDLSTEILYKLTDTAFTEAENDLSIGADGKVYVTWVQRKQVSPYDLDVYALSFTRLPRSSFTVHALFDQTHSYKLGGVVPIRLQLWNAQGSNISAPTLILNATGVVQRDSSSAPLGVESPGNANPDNNFRYDATLPGYIYNLSTKNLAVGTWELQFKVSGSSAPYGITFDLR